MVEAPRRNVVEWRWFHRVSLLPCAGSDRLRFGHSPKQTKYVCPQAYKFVVFLGGDLVPRARQAYMNHLESEASLVAATHWIAGKNLGTMHQNQLLKRALDQATKPLMRYRCAACGFEATQHFWHCPGCQAWDSYPARRIEEL